MRPWFDHWIRKIPGEGNGTCSSILACTRVPCTEEPGVLQSMESHRVGHDWVLMLFLSLFSLFGTTSNVSVLKPLMGPLLSSYSVGNFAFYFTKKNEAIRREQTNAHHHNCIPISVCTYKLRLMQCDYKHTVHASTQSQPLYVCARSLQFYWPKVITPLRCPFKKKLALQLQRGQLDDGLQLQSLFIDLNFQGKILASYIALGKWWIIKKIWGSIHFSSTSEIFAPEFLLFRIKLCLLSLVSIAFHFTDIRSEWQIWKLPLPNHFPSPFIFQTFLTGNFLRL